MMTKQELENNISEVLTEADNSQDKVQKFKLIWQGSVKPALGIVKLITGRRTDMRIDELIEAADNLSEGNPSGESKFCAVWNNLHARSLLKAIQIITGPKVDKALNKFIDIADSICGPEEVEEP